MSEILRRGATVLNNGATGVGRTHSQTGRHSMGNNPGDKNDEHRHYDFYTAPSSANFRGYGHHQEAVVDGDEIEEDGGRGISSNGYRDSNGNNCMDDLSNLNLAQVKYREYATHDSRMGSFEGWPSRYFTQTPSELAEAGFYYTGTADRVECFCCGLRIQKWKPNEDPLSTHSNRSPHCEFLRNKHGNINTSSYEPCPEWAAVCSPVENALKMGFSETVICQVITQSNGRTTNNTDLFNLIEAILNKELGQHGKFLDQFEETHEIRNANQDENSDRKQPQRPDTNNKTTSTNSSNLSDHLTKENLKLKESRICKKCRKNEAVILCLPCGHIAGCEGCTEKTHNCFVCKERILGTVRTYLA